MHLLLLLLGALLSLAAVASAADPHVYYLTRMSLDCNDPYTARVMVDGDMDYYPQSGDSRCGDGQITITAVPGSPLQVVANATSTGMFGETSVVTATLGVCTSFPYTYCRSQFRVLVNRIVTGQRLTVSFYQNPSCTRPAAEQPLAAASGLCQYQPTQRRFSSMYTQLSLLDDNTVFYGFGESAFCAYPVSGTQRGLAPLSTCIPLSSDASYMRIDLSDSTSASVASESSPNSDSASSSAALGAAIGGAIGGVLVVALLVLAALVVVRRRPSNGAARFVLRFLHPICLPCCI